MKQNKLKSKFQEELRQNYDIISMLTSEASFLDQISYQDRLYLILNNNVPFCKILYFCRKQYPNQQPEIGKMDLIRDAIKLKSEVVSYAWRFDRADPKRKQHRSFSLDNVGINNKHEDNENKEQGEISEKKAEHKEKSQKTAQKSNKKVQTKDKKKIIVLQQLLANTQGKITMTKNQQQQAELIKKYNQINKQLNYLRNKIRIESQTQILKEIKQQSAGGQVPVKLKHILAKMREIKQGNKKILGREDSALKQKNYMKRELEIFRLNQIFIFYSKKQTQIQAKYFGQIQKSQSVLHLQLFVKFCHDWKINRILTIDQITNVFKSHSKGKRFIDSLQFTQILGDIHRLECIKEQRPITVDSITNYIQKHIVNEEKMIMVGVKVENDMKKKDKKSEKKIMKGHTGKHQFDIRQDIEEKKKTIDFLAGPRNALKYDKLKQKFKSIEVMENSRTKVSTNYDKDRTINSNDTINSYAFRFKYKNRKTRIRTEGVHEIESFNQRQFLKNQTSLFLEQNTENINNRKKTYDIRYQKQENNANFEPENQGEKGQGVKKKKFEGFDDLIEQSEQDQYLNKHLLPPINTKNNNNLFKIIHY